MDAHRPNKAFAGIFFYDGDCGLCDRSVRSLIAIDRHKRIAFAPLQGKTAEKVLPEPLRRRKDLDTVVYVPNKLPHEDAELYTHSSAVIHTLTAIGGFWKFIGQAVNLLPASLRDRLYNAIARRRHRFFPKPQCSIVDPAEHERLLH